MAFKSVIPGGSVVLGCLATMGLGLILQIVGTATVAWIQMENGIAVGLWAMVVEGETRKIPGDADVCSAGKSRMQAAQALSIIGILISAAYVVFAVVDKMKAQVPVVWLGGGLTFLLLVFTIATWAIWLGWYFKDPCDGESVRTNAKMGYSFYLYLFGSLLSTAACATHLVTRSFKANAPNSFQDTHLVGKFAPDVETCAVGYKIQPQSAPVNSPSSHANKINYKYNTQGL